MKRDESRERHGGARPSGDAKQTEIRDDPARGGRMIGMCLISSLIGLVAAIHIVQSMPLPGILALPIMSLAGMSLLFVIAIANALLTR